MANKYQILMEADIYDTEYEGKVLEFEHLDMDLVREFYQIFYKVVYEEGISFSDKTSEGVPLILQRMVELWQRPLDYVQDLYEKYCGLKFLKDGANHSIRDVYMEEYGTKVHDHLYTNSTGFDQTKHQNLKDAEWSDYTHKYRKGT